MSGDFIYSALINQNEMHVSWNVPIYIRQTFECYFGRPMSQWELNIKIVDETDSYSDESNSQTHQEVILKDDCSEWVMKGLQEKRSYRVELGIKLSDQGFFPILLSEENSAENKTNSRSWAKHVSTYTSYENVHRNNWNWLYAKRQRMIDVTAANNDSSCMIDNFQCSPYINECPNKKILMLTWEYPPHIIGGLARHVYGLSQGLKKMGHEVHVLTANPKNEIPDEIIEGVHIHRVSPLNDNDSDFLSWIGGLNIAMVRKAVQLFAAHPFAVIHAHDWLVGASAITLRTLFNCPLIATIHATEHGRNQGIYTELQKFIHEKETDLIHAADQMIVCSKFMENDLKKVFLFSRQKCSIIPNAVEPMNTKAGNIENKAPAAVQKNKKLIFSIGRMVREKGFDTLIDTAAALKDRYPDIYFIIAGKGPMLDHFRRKVSDLNLCGTVYFPGFISEDLKNAFYQECFMTVFPSHYEPFGIVAIESLAFAKPTIVSDTGGLKEIVLHKETGFLAAPNDCGSLTDQMIFILEHEEQANEIGQNGKKLVESIFSWERVAHQTEEVYAKAIANRDENLYKV